MLNLYFNIGYIFNFKELFYVFNCIEILWLLILIKIRWLLFDIFGNFLVGDLGMSFMYRYSVVRDFFLGEVSMFFSKGFSFYISSKCKWCYINLKKIFSLYY